MSLPVLPLRHELDRPILRLALPAFGALVAEPLFLLADSAFVGRLGTSQLAGLAIAVTILHTAVSLCIFLAYGTTAAVARRLGADDLPGALRLGMDGLWLAAILGGLLALTGAASAEIVVGWFGPEPDAAHHAVTYLRISTVGLPAMLAIFAMTGLLRGLQDTRTPLYMAVASNLINVALNYLLIYVAGLGVGGAALGTILVQWGSVLAYLAVVQGALRRHQVPLSPSLPGILNSFRASAPLLLRNVSLRVVIVLSTVAAASFGTAELAAHQVAFTVWTALALGLDAIAIAGQALVGRYLGASDIAGARRATNRMVELSVLFGFLLAAVLIMGRDAIPPLFTDDAEVRHVLSATLLIIAVLQPAAGWVFALDGVLIGAGDARYLAFAQMLTVGAFAPLAGLVMAADLGLSALWWAIGAWVAARLALLWWRARGDEWAVTGASR